MTNLIGGHKKLCRKSMSLIFDDSATGLSIGMHHKMAQLVSSIERHRATRSRERFRYGLDLNYGLSEYLAGGAGQLGQKRELAALLDQLKDAQQIPSKVSISVNPHFFAPLLELMIRLLRRGDLLTDVLRLLEYQSSAAIAGDRVGAEAAFGSRYNRFAAKLATDVVDFLVAAADLDPNFREVSRELLLGTPAKAFGTGSEETATLFSLPAEGKRNSRSPSEKLEED